MNLSGTQGPPTPDARTYVHVIELGRDHHLSIVTEDPHDAPDEAVRLEMQAVANACAGTATRGIAADILAQVVNGIIGGAAWAGVAAGLSATRRYVQRLKARRPAATAETVSINISVAYEYFLGIRPPSQLASRIERCADGAWTTTIAYDGVTMDARIDVTGSLIIWSHRPTTKGAALPQ